jgi:hypothetical protein
LRGSSESDINLESYSDGLPFQSLPATSGASGWETSV